MRYKDDNIRQKRIKTAINGRKEAIQNYEKQPSRFTLNVVLAWVRLLSKRIREEK